MNSSFEAFGVNTSERIHSSLGEQANQKMDHNHRKKCIIASVDSYLVWASRKSLQASGCVGK